MWRVIVAWSVAGCSSPASAPASPQPALTNVSTTPSRQRPPPTLANAGAKTCTLREPVVIGPHAEGDIVVAFDHESGLAAWNRAPVVLGLQAIALDGTKLGAAFTVTIPDAVEPHMMFALGGRFVVLLRRWDWKAKDLNWWGVVIDRTGRATHAPVDLGLADLDIATGEALDEHRVGLVVGPATISKNQNQPARSVTLTTTPTGLASRFADLRAPAARAADALEVRVVNGAVPGGRGPGGMIIEGIGRPIMERTLRGQPVGASLQLERNGNPIAHGMNVSHTIVWSGTHFIYPFWDDDGGPTHDKYVHRLLPIDCRP